MSHALFMCEATETLNSKVVNRYLGVSMVVMAGAGKGGEQRVERARPATLDEALELEERMVLLEEALRFAGAPVAARMLAAARDGLWFELRVLGVAQASRRQ